MYAVVSSGGKQYRVEPGTTLTVERIGAEAGAAVTFDRVLLIGDGEAVTVGTPIVAGASVSATVLGEELGPKLVIFKFKQKVKYRRRTGHRQHLVRVRIDTINADGSAKSKAKAAKADAPAAEPEAAPAKAEVAAAPAKPRARRAKAETSAEAETSAKAETSASEAKPATAKPRAPRKAKPKAAKAEE